MVIPRCDAIGPGGIGVWNHSTGKETIGVFDTRRFSSWVSTTNVLELLSRDEVTAISIRPIAKNFFRSSACDLKVEFFAAHH